MNKKKTIITAVGLSSTFSLAAAGMGVVAGLHVEVIKDGSIKEVIKNVGHNINNPTGSFKYLKNDDIANKINDLMNQISSNQTINEKNASINNVRETILDNLIENFPDSIKESENEFLRNLLQDQINFITETDLRNEFISKNSDLIDQIIKNSNNPENSQKTKELLNTFKTNLNSQLNRQAELFKPYIDYINEIIGVGEERLPDSEIDKLYKDYEGLILSKDLNLNSLETLKSQIDEYKNNKDNNNQLNSLKNSIRELIEQNKQLINNPDPKLAENIESKLESITSKEDLVLYEELLRNNLTHSSDLLKNAEELKQSLKDLIKNNPLNEFKEKFEQINGLNEQLIDQVNDVNELAKLKDKYLDDLAYFKYAEDKHNEINDYLNSSYVNVDITQSDYKKLTADNFIDSIFNKVKSKEDLKSNIDLVYNEYQQIKNNGILSNKQIDQLLKDLEFYDNYKDTKNTVQISNNQIREKLKTAQNNDALQSLDLNVYTKLLEEKLRQNGKEQLKYLEEKSKLMVKKLSGMEDPVSRAIVEKINQLNKESSLLSDEHSPATTNQLKEQILKYDLLDSIEKISNLNYDLLNKNNDIKELANSIFPPSIREDELYKNTLDELAKIEDFVNSNKDNLDILSNPEKFDELINKLEDLKNNQKEIEKNLREKNKLDNLIKEFENRNNFVEENPEIKEIASKELDKIKKELDDLRNQLNDPLLDNSKAKEIINQIEAKVQEQKTTVDLAISQNELDKTLATINQNYPDDQNRENDSIGEKGLRKKYEQIKEKILNPDLSDLERNKLITELKEIRDTAPKIKELEDAKEVLENSISNARSSQHDKITDSKLISSNSALKIVDSTIEEMLSDKYPKISKIVDSTNLALKQAEMLDLALKQDKIIIANNELQKKNLAIENESYLPIKKAFDQINGFVDLTSRIDDENIINESTEKIYSMIPLADELNNLYNFVESIKDQPEYKLLKDQAEALIQRSLFNQDRTPSQIADTVKEIQESLKVFEAKKKLNEEIKRLDEIFDDSDPNNKESDRAIYSEIKKSVEDLKQQNKLLFNSPYETESSILQAFEELKNQHKKLSDNKDQITRDYNDIVKKTEEKIKNYDDNIIPSDKQGNSSNTYTKYDETKADFKNKKDQKETTISDIKELNTKLDIAYKYDQANNAIKHLEDYINSAATINEFNSDAELNKVKKAFDEMINQLKTDLAKPTNFNKNTLEDIINKANAGLELAKFQEDPVLINIKELKDNTAKVEDYNSLKKSSLNTLPTSPYDASTIIKTKERLVNETNNILEVAKIRESNERGIGNNDEVSLSGLYKRAKEQLANTDTNDQQAYKEFIAKLDELKAKNTAATTKDEVVQIQAEIAHLDQRLDALKKLSAAVKQEQLAKEKIESTTSNHETTREFLDKFLPSINKNIKDSQALYMNKTIDIDTLISKANSINGTEGYPHVKELNNALELASKTTELMNKIKNSVSLNPDINYHEYDSVDGNINNYNLWDRWFKDLLSSFYNNRNEENYLNLNNLINKVSELFNKQKEVSEKIKSRKDEVKTYAGYQSDVDYLIVKLWASTPKSFSEFSDTNSWIANIDERIATLDENIQTEKQNYDKRTALKNNFETYKTDKIEVLASTDRKLKEALKTRIEDLEQKNISSLNGESLKEGLSTITFSEIENQYNTLTTIYDKITELSGRVAIANEIILNFSSTQDSEFAAELERLKNKCADIESKYIKYDSIEKQDGKTDIVTDLNDLNKTLVKIEFIYEKTKLLTLINSNLELSREEKAPLLNVLSNAEAEFNQKISNATIDQYSAILTEIKDKYFVAAAKTPATEVVEGSSNKIYQLFENSVLLKKLVVKAQSTTEYQLSTVEDPNNLIDSAETRKIYEQLNSEIQKAKTRLTDNSIDESNKKASYETLNNLLTQLKTSKANDAQKIINRANELKTYMETVDSYNKSYTPSTEFIQTAITKVTEKKAAFESDSIDINELNQALKDADVAIKNEVLSLFNQVRDWVIQERNASKEYRDKFTLESTWTGVDLRAETYNSLKQAIADSKVVETTDTKNYRESIDYKNILETQYKNKYAALKQTKESFISELKSGFKKYLDTNSASKGLFIKFDESMNPYINNSTDRLLENAEFNSTISFYRNTFTPLLEQLKNEFTTKSPDTYLEASGLATFGHQVSQLRTEFNKLIQIMLTDSKHYTNTNYRGSLNEIISEISNNVNDESFNTVKSNYQAEIDKLNADINKTEQLYTSNSNDIETYVTNFIEIFKKVESIYKWINVQNNENLLLNKITTSDNFNKIVAKDNSRRIEFVNAITTLAPTQDSNQNYIDITTTKSILNYFNSFAFTDIDLSSIINNDNVKIRIKKLSDQSWYEYVNSTDANYQKVKIKLEYLYTPNNLRVFKNKDEVSIEKEIILQFKTENTIKIQSGSSDVFVKKVDNADKYGIDAKVEVLDLEKSGLLDDTANTNEKIQEIVFNAFKQNVLKNQTKIIINPEDRLGTSNTEVGNNIKNNKYDFALSSSAYNSIDQFIGMIGDFDNQSLVIMADDTDKTINIISIVPNKVVSAKTKTNKFYQENLGWLLGKDINTATVDDSMPFAIASLYKFKFTVEGQDRNKKLMMYLDFYQSSIFGKHSKLTDTSVKPVATKNDRIIWSSKDFAEYLSKNDSLIYDSTKKMLYTVYDFDNNRELTDKYILDHQQNKVVMLGMNTVVDIEGKEKNFNFRQGWLFIKNGQLTPNMNIMQTSTLYSSGVIELYFKLRDN
ncbi:hypothetical protein MADP15_00027 [Mycoplasma anatis]|uniref:hypothetical protein n=1 Tax=Mycoplasmopsis anatis TaxID=171279 RepID=UPI001C4E0377|nr:hypothetical protein [Mycoplasmopsis anatis]MBW0595744.1 hypothetical protein [Mycoplasmopsis anatis]MBW0600287.1 hypothetical protein [Mycoplasmopsis anatis]